MTSSVDVHQCDYFRLHSLPPDFTSERAELIYINEQIASLDVHISQLNALREDLQHRSCQLHNSLSPIRALPVEVLSYIFQQLIGTEGHFGENFHCYQKRLAQALVLSSVTSHLRRVALGTPMLWKYIPLHIPNKEAIDGASSLLQHCTALTSCVSISIMDKVEEEVLGSPFDLLLTPDVTRKVKDFELYTSRHAAVWGKKLGESSFPLLDALSMSAYGNNPYDFGSLKTLTRLRISNRFLTTLTRLRISNRFLSHPVVVPPSVQHLCIEAVTPQVFLSVVHHCLNLVNCKVDFDLDDDTPFPEPVNLNHLKRLDINVSEVTQSDALVERMILPSLETLEIEYRLGDTLAAFFPLCQSFSATITTLVIKASCDTLPIDDLHPLCRLSLPKLEQLQFLFDDFVPIVNATRVLALLDNELSKSTTHHLPALRFVLLRCSEEIEPPLLLQLLNIWRIGKALYFHVWIKPDRLYNCWPPELLEELNSVVGRRRVVITWGESHIYG